MNRNQLYAVLAVVVAVAILVTILFSTGAPEIMDGEEPATLSDSPEGGTEGAAEAPAGASPEPSEEGG